MKMITVTWTRIRNEVKSGDQAVLEMNLKSLD